MTWLLCQVNTTFCTICLTLPKGGALGPAFSKQRRHGYMAEFDFRYSNRSALGCEDVARAVRALEGVIGKRLTYKGPDWRTARTTRKAPQESAVAHW